MKICIKLQGIKGKIEAPSATAAAAAAGAATSSRAAVNQQPVGVQSLQITVAAEVDEKKIPLVLEMPTGALQKLAAPSRNDEGCVTWHATLSHAFTTQQHIPCLLCSAICSSMHGAGLASLSLLTACR